MVRGTIKGHYRYLKALEDFHPGNGIMPSILDSYSEISSTGWGGELKGLHLTPERQEVPGEKSCHSTQVLLELKHSRKIKQTKGELEPFTKGGALGLMDSLIFEFPEVSG